MPTDDALRRRDFLARTIGGTSLLAVGSIVPEFLASTALAAGGLIGAVVVRQPVGVVACITPYNFPIVNMAGKIGPAPAMGNTAVAIHVDDFESAAAALEGQGFTLFTENDLKE